MQHPGIAKNELGVPPILIAAITIRMNDRAAGSKAAKISLKFVSVAVVRAIRSQLDNSYIVIVSTVLRIRNHPDLLIAWR
ncbi:hypothetical protein OAM69_06125 [bacterium]|nr:hypothetical protein [bacterium]